MVKLDSKVRRIISVNVIGVGPIFLPELGEGEVEVGPDQSGYGPVPSLFSWGKATGRRSMRSFAMEGSWKDHYLFQDAENKDYHLVFVLFHEESGKDSFLCFRAKDAELLKPIYEQWEEKPLAQEKKNWLTLSYESELRQIMDKLVGLNLRQAEVLRLLNMSLAEDRKG